MCSSGKNARCSGSSNTTRAGARPATISQKMQDEVMDRGSSDRVGRAYTGQPARHVARAYAEPPIPVEANMTVCPIAIVAGCRKCPAFTVCPLKSVLGDHGKDEPAAPKPGATASRSKPAGKN